MLFTQKVSRQILYLKWKLNKILAAIDLHVLLKLYRTINTGIGQAKVLLLQSLVVNSYIPYTLCVYLLGVYNTDVNVYNSFFLAHIVFSVNEFLVSIVYTSIHIPRFTFLRVCIEKLIKKNTPANIKMLSRNTPIECTKWLNVSASLLGLKQA